MALDETSAAGGTIEYARGSHRWAVAPPIRRFHAPDDYREDFREAAARAGYEPEIVPVEVPAGRRRLPPRPHLARLRPQPRRPPAPVAGQPLHRRRRRFHPTEVSYIYSRYKRVGDETMDESFFPVLWTEARRADRYGWAGERGRLPVRRRALPAACAIAPDRGLPLRPVPPLARTFRRLHRRAEGGLELTAAADLAWYRSSDAAERGFCRVCGSSLFWRADRRDHVSIAAGSLDDSSGLRLAEHIFVADKAGYYELTDGLPQRERGLG